MVKVLLFTALTLFVLLARYPSHDVYGQSPIPSGKVSIASNSIALAVGVNWGEGLLTFKGKGKLFAVDGLTLVDVGIAKATAVGEVYNLTDVSLSLKGPTWPVKPDLPWREAWAAYPCATRTVSSCSCAAVSEEGRCCNLAGAE